MMSSKQRQLKLLGTNSNPQTDYDITIKGLAHQIPIDVFEQETKLFFAKLSY
jgi:hypothetical protein